MRSGTNEIVFGILLCLLVPVVVQAQPDEIVPWDPADHLRAHWKSVSLRAQLYNPAEQPDRATSTERSLSVAGGIDILDPNGLIGVSTTSRRAMVFDQNGDEIYSTPGSRSHIRIYHAPRTRPMLGLTGGITYDVAEYFSVSVPMDPNLGFPSELSRLEYSLGVLIADVTDVIDIPFAPSQEWIELVPGLRILIAEASTEEGRYEYRAEFEYDPNLVSYGSGLSLFLYGDETVPPVVVTDIEVLDANGVSVRDRSAGGAFSGVSTSRGSGDLITGTTTVRGSCSACGEAAIIRYTLAIAAYEREVELVFEDIPVPTF